MKVVSVNISEKKGVIKTPVSEIIINEKGVVSDAHSGSWHRQVSILDVMSINKFVKASGRHTNPGEFAENITTEGLDYKSVSVFDRIKVGQALLEITQIGKKCHGKGCAIYTEVGNCVMPKEGFFCRVINGGKVQAGDELVHYPKTLSIHVITLSDRASACEYKDTSGPLITELLQKHLESEGARFEIINILISDDASRLKDLLLEHKKTADFIFTTGGTGIGPRDFTPEVVAELTNKIIPGIMDNIRIKYGATNPNALLSRSVAAVLDNAILFTLPGSEKAIREYMTEILKVLSHMRLMIHGLGH